MIALVTGAASSGKSAYAEDLAMGLAPLRLYLATMSPEGQAAQERIARHRALRAGKGFHTVEACDGFGRALAMPASGVALVEDLGNLVFRLRPLRPRGCRRERSRCGRPWPREADGPIRARVGSRCLLVRRALRHGGGGRVRRAQCGQGRGAGRGCCRMDVLRSLVIAFACFSKIPMPRVDWREQSMRYCMCFFPLVGLVIGLCVWAWAWLCGVLGFGALLRGAGIALAPLAVTGGIHMDGFADVVDAQSSHAEPDRKRQICHMPPWQRSSPRAGGSASCWPAFTG